MNDRLVTGKLFRIAPKKKAVEPEEKLPVLPQSTQVDVVPVFEVHMPPSDMTPVIDVIKQMMSEMPVPNVSFTAPAEEEKEDRKPRRVRVTVEERDTRGSIKSLICEEIIDAS